MTATLTCRTCSRSFTVDHDPENPFSAAALRMTRHCPACAQKLVASHEVADREARKAALEARWERLCPEEYRNTDIDDKRIAAAFSGAARAWTGKRGLWLIGESGMGKSRCLYFALRNAFTRGLWTAAVSHMDLRKLVQAQFTGSDDSRATAERRLETLRKVDVLLFDDLGKAPSTEGADCEVFELFEHRFVRRKPILGSSNAGGEWLEKRFGPERGPALVRRIAEFCEVVKL